MDIALEQTPAAPRKNRRTFFRLIGFLRPYRVGLAISVVLAVGAQAAQIAIILLSGAAIGAIKSGHHHQLWTLIALIVATGVARALFMSGRRFIAGNQALGVEYDLRMRIYSKLVRLSFSFFDRHQTGQLLSRSTVDLTLVRFFLGYGLIFFAQHVLTVFGVAGGDALPRLAAGAGDDRRDAADHRRRLPLQPHLPPGAPRRAAEDGRRRHLGRGEHHRRARGQGLRPGGRRGGALRRAERAPVCAQHPGQPPAVLLHPAARLHSAPCPGRRAPLRRLDGDPRPARAAVVRLLRLPAQHADVSAAPDRQLDRAGAAGDRVRRAHLRDRRRARGDRRAPRRTQAPGRARRDSLREGGLLLRDRANGAGGDRPRAGAREDRGADRADRLGQDDARLAGAALLRRDSRARARGRRRRARARALGAQAADRRDRPGSLPLLGQRAREHRLRAPRREPRGGRERRPAGAGARVHRAPSRRLRDRAGRARRHALGRPAPAPGDRAGAPDQSAHPDPRRRHRLGRRHHRGADPRRAGAGGARAHHDRDRAPALDDRPGRRDRRARAGADRRPRQPRAAARHAPRSTARSTSTGWSSRRWPGAWRSTPATAAETEGRRGEGLAAPSAPDAGRQREGAGLVLAPDGQASAHAGTSSSLPTRAGRLWPCSRCWRPRRPASLLRFSAKLAIDRGITQGRHARARDHRDRLPRGRAGELGDRLRRELLHRLGGRAHPRRPAPQAVRAPAAALARLLRAQPHRRDRQPHDQRHRGARPARHRRRLDPDPEHADAGRLGRDPVRARLAAGAGDPDRDAADARRHDGLPSSTRPAPTEPSGSGSATSPARSPRTSAACASFRPTRASRSGCATSPR